MVEPLVYGKIKLNEDIGPIKYFIPADFNEKRLEALSIRNSDFLKSKEGKLFVEPSVLCGQHSWVFRTKYSWEGSVHAKCEVQYLKPILPGTYIRVSGRIVDQYERRGGRYFVFELNTWDEQEDPVCTVKNTMLANLKELLEYRKKAAETGKGASKPSQAAQERKKAEVSIALEPKELTRREILLFHKTEENAYGLHTCIHNDIEVAKKAGLPDIIAPGRYSLGLMNALFGNIWGDVWLKRGSYQVSFLNNLLPGAQLQVNAEMVTGKSEGRDDRKKVFNIVCRDNATGRDLLAGKASIDLR